MGADAGREGRSLAAAALEAAAVGGARPSTEAELGRLGLGLTCNAMGAPVGTTSAMDGRLLLLLLLRTLPPSMAAPHNGAAHRAQASGGNLCEGRRDQPQPSLARAPWWASTTTAPTSFPLAAVTNTGTSSHSPAKNRRFAWAGVFAAFLVAKSGDLIHRAIGFPTPITADTRRASAR